MELQHIEFIVNDEESLQKVDRMHEITEIQMSRESLTPEEDAAMRKEFEELAESIESKYGIDEDLDYYGSIEYAWMCVCGMGYSRKDLIDAIKKEQEKRKTRKRQPKIIKERALEYGLW